MCCVMVMVVLIVLIMLLNLVWFVFVKFSVVLWFIDVCMNGRFSVMFMLCLKVLYLSGVKFWLWYIVSM